MFRYLKSYASKEKRWLLIALVPSIIWMEIAYQLEGNCDAFAVGSGVTLLIIGYAIIATSANRYVTMNDRNVLGSITLFVALAFIFITFYSVYYYVFQLVSPSDATQLGHLRAADVFYFSTVTFTTLGYGDILPNSTLARGVVVSQALLGITHTVFFIFIFLTRSQSRKE